MASEVKPVRRVQKAVLAKTRKHILIHVNEQIAHRRVQNRLLVVLAKALELPAAHMDIGMLECLEITNELNQSIESEAKYFPLAIQGVLEE
ncbi:hypothetical protein LTR99_000529 [Exophiala xenobiotica]|uniref:Uncharacterized protein n=1 Tax=Vermiconidia calcicola TaxID=1690605 RepID=A0AAV9QIS5_9PEZI|nr:hypothetical protein LTR96_000812 [Exophiala xenobiotica]KAK5543645.1 hypothetical protein LTR25_001259 [Vermiconidia calcicola]KAK5548322.1 hypothetical protein LTR23_001451 [Chaetothyriales sp. CCFEE 6169]KAK5307557.1 hypothetical protein LTR99_000529 [Exophiala xenobiotica]KAK5343540.1 hypothetical protein LTR98_001169 [Exophiala xenobiotica]